MKTRNIIFFLTGLLAFTSCEDMFEPAKENTRQLEAMVQETDYVYGLLIYGYNRLPYIRTTQTDVATDDAIANVDDSYTKMANGEWKSDNNPMSQWDACKDGIQYVNLFLKYVKDVNWAQSAKSKQQMFIDRLTGEALGLRAIFYYHLLQAHAGYTNDGELLGVPLLTEPEDGSSDYNQPRASFAACVRQIFADCDAAAALLPDQYKDIDDVEKITKNKEEYLALGVQTSGYNLVFGKMARNLVSGKVAQAVKAQTALLAASPAFQSQSGVTAEEAAKICAEVLKNVEFDATGNTWYKNVEALSSSAASMDEILWRADWEKADASQELDNFPPSLNGKGKVNPSQNLVDAFPMANGYPISDSRSGYDANDPYTGRDPRLSDDVYYNGSTLKSVVIATGTYASSTTDAGTKDNINNSGSAHTLTGYYLRKLLREDAGPTIGSSSSSQQPHIFPRIRYTELFLAYAETANEAWGPNGKAPGFNLSAYDVIKMIRQRGGIGTDENGDYVGDPYLDECANDKAKMRELIRNERRIELCFENKRFWDIRRWNLPLNESVMGVQIDKIEEDGTLKYTPLVVAPRQYETYMNFGPIPNSEVLLWSALQQNKDW
ncbi:MAG: RagB/SusD family nutrient uptake outer membrane protein [Prevotella sp.]|nr:RagB/SusD family nutrient uptake outer membrane protein [Prevotella sp.]